MARRKKNDDDDDRPLDPDRIDGSAHPRETTALVGHDIAEAAFLETWRAGRAHHALILSGPPGIGKATFAYRLARFLLTREAMDPGLFGDAAPPSPPTSLDPPDQHPALPIIASGAHPQLIVLRRPWDHKTKKFKTVISVDTVRRLIEMFHLSSADGGWRVAIVDPADELNTAAANALLKLIEEPPPRAMFLLVSHAPGRLPATIRSRCRRLDFRAPPFESAMQALKTAAPYVDEEDATKLLTLAENAPGEALRLEALNGGEVYRDVVDLFRALPQLEYSKITSLMQASARRGGVERFRAVGGLLRLTCERLARAGVNGPPAREAIRGEAALLRRLSPDPRAARIWAETALETAAKHDLSLELNLDPEWSVMEMAGYIYEQTQRIFARAA